MRIGTALCVAGILIIARPAFAQSPSAQIGERVQDGQRVSITDAQGRTVSGRIAGKDADGLTILNGRTRSQIRYEQIASIDKPKDRIWNGALYGLLAGGALGWISAATQPDHSNEPFCGVGFFDECTDTTGLEVVMGGVVGFAVGAGVDAIIGGNRNIYRRDTRLTLAPAYRRGGGGVSVSITW